MRGAASIVLLLCAGMLQAQQDEFRSKLSVQGGLVRSLGDITSGLETFDPERTAMLGVSYERFISYGVSLYGGYAHLRLSGNDRESGLKDRSLNFLAEVNTAQLGLRFYADNGRLLNYDARFAPFVQLGIGAGVYEVYGDLYDGTGARYNYWSDGTIRTLPEGAPDVASAQLMEQNGVFETRLTDLATEEGKPSDTWFMFVPARIGMKWRISDRFSAELAYAFNWTFTDHLDDVSGDYPASFATEELAYISNPAGHAGPRGDNGQNDHYHHLSLGLSVGLGRRSHRFRMPPVRAMAPVAGIPAVRKDSVVVPPTPVAAPSDTATKRVIIEVESIRVARLEVDTIIMRGSPTADTLVVPEKMLEKVKVKETEGKELRTPPDTVLLKTTPDTLSQLELPLDTIATPPSVDADPTPRKATSDTLSTPLQEPKERADPAPKDAGSAEPAPAGTVERKTTERIIERTVPPVVVVQKELVRDTVVKEVPVVVRDTISVKADTAAVDPQHTLTKVAPPSTPPVRSEPAPHVRSALEMQRDHALQMNRILNDRILTLERYLATQEEVDGAAERDSLRQRIAVLDKQLAAKRAEAPERVDDPEERVVLTDSVRFASESFNVRTDYRAKLEATAQRLIEQDVKKVLVTGHTDRAGDAQYNLELSQLRAEAVAEILREAGVPAERIKVKGLGQELAQERHDRNERVVIVQAVPVE